MGCFDTIKTVCPCCRGTILFVSKAGECMMKEYTFYNVPANIAGDLDGEIGECEMCGCEIKLHTQTNIQVELI